MSYSITEQVQQNVTHYYQSLVVTGTEIEGKSPNENKLSNDSYQGEENRGEISPREEVLLLVHTIRDLIDCHLLLSD